MYQLVPGSVLLGYPGDEYVCTHERDGGDECLSFHVSERFLDALGPEGAVWRAGAVPPRSELVVLGELAQAAADGASDVGLDEVAMWLAGRLVQTLSTHERASALPVSRDRARAIEAALWIDTHAAEPIDLEGAARQAGLSAFHFLRVFRGVLGLTPHQHLIRSRLRHAARRLAAGQTSITDVALDVGFGDVSNFVRTFHRAAGLSPRRFRRMAVGDRAMAASRRKILQERPDRRRDDARRRRQPWLPSAGRS